MGSGVGSPPEPPGLPAYQSFLIWVGLVLVLLHVLGSRAIAFEGDG
jgi:hypothetical protein